MAWNPQALQLREPRPDSSGVFKPIPQTFGSTAAVVAGQQPVLVNVEACRPIVQLIVLQASAAAGAFVITEGSGRATLTHRVTATAGGRIVQQVAGETIRVSFDATGSAQVTALLASFV